MAEDHMVLFPRINVLPSPEERAVITLKYNILL
jgi:hypothetical protein